MNNPTPIVRQYLALKREAPHGSILLLRVGESYGIFGKENVDEVRDILSLFYANQHGGRKESAK